MSPAKTAAERKVNISYNSSVYTKAGWRHVSIEAEAEQISAGKGLVH